MKFTGKSLAVFFTLLFQVRRFPYMFSIGLVTHLIDEEQPTHTSQYHHELPATHKGAEEARMEKKAKGNNTDEGNREHARTGQGLFKLSSAG